ncbi:Cytidine deaminase [Orchesella cincta]|uniref:Cytidine deaminase n=1 Tax=Orchesella cincta TaxID=48709 RepID=A0A1D2N7V1_ORCCI|nr:Cytidine deaminase [Orchesella cincta]
MEIKDLSDLDDVVQTLIQKSVEAREKAYCPYSNFAVGSALYCDDGTIVTGCNVECIVLGLTNCAERTAVFKAVSEGKTKFTMVAVSAVNKDKIVSPCGQCRQMLAEFNPRIPIYLYNPDTKMVGCQTLEYFLPHSFNPENVRLNENK